MLRSHGRYDHSPIVSRPAGTWPNGRGLAVYVALNLEHYAWTVALTRMMRDNVRLTRQAYVEFDLEAEELQRAGVERAAVGVAGSFIGSDTVTVVPPPGSVTICIDARSP